MTGLERDARFWDRIAPKYATDPITDMGGYERTLERTRHYLRPTDQVFEFACGTGTTALALAPAVRSLMATDLSAEMIRIARSKAQAQRCNNILFAQGTLESLPSEVGTYDVVLGFNALHMVRDVPEALSRIRHRLRPGGLFIGKTPCIGDRVLLRLAVPVARLLGKAPYVSPLTSAGLARAIANAGFEMVELAMHGTKGMDIRPFHVARAV